MFMTKEESNFFMGFIDKTKRVLEYGSGQSTIEIANKCLSIVSIEHQLKWFDDISIKAPDNCTVVYRPPDVQYKEGGDDGSADQFKSYIAAPLEFGPFDVILIDGRARYDCSLICENLGEDPEIFVHDFHREECKPILNHLKLVEMVGTLARLKINGIYP